MKLKKLAIATAVTAALAGVAMPANAVVSQAVAQALMNVTNFKFLGVGTTQLSILDFTSYGYTDTLTNTASLNGPAVIFSKTQTGTNAFVQTVDALMACLGSGCGVNGNTENNFTTATLNGHVPPAGTPGGLFSRGDSLLTGAPIITGAPGVDTSVNANTVAETSLNANNGAGGATADMLVGSSISFTTGHAIGALGISFDIQELLRSWTNPGSILGTNAAAQFNWEIRLQDGTTVLADWIPDGSTTTGTQFGLTVEQEDCAMTRATAAGANDPQAAFNCSGSARAHTTFALAADHSYSVSITQHVITNANTSQVPEPATLALLGAGLVGLGFSRRRKTA